MSTHEGRLFHHLNLLPDGVLENIIRLLSNEPSNSNWRSTFPIDLALQLFRGDGPLSRAARRTLTSLSTTYDHQGSLMIRDFEDLSDVLMDAGPVLKELHVNLQASSRNWVSTFVSTCTSVTSLTLRDLYSGSPLCAMLQSCSGRLRRLAQYGDELNAREVESISRHCIGLRELTLIMDVTADLRAMWSAVGPTLKKLEYRSLGRIDEPCFDADYSSVQKCLTNMAAFCPHIREFSMFCASQSVAMCFVRLLKGYGEKVHRLALRVAGPPCPELLADMTEACPSAAVTASVCGEAPANILRALHACADELQFMRVLQPTREFERAAATCTNIRELFFDNGDAATPLVLRALLAQPKPKLEDLTLCFDGNDEDTFDAIAASCEVVANSVQSLRQFELYSKLLPATELQQLAKANPGLNMIFFEYSGDSFLEESEDGEEVIMDDCVIDITEAFLACPNIRSFVFNELSENAANYDVKFSSLEDLCCPLRHRNVFVKLMDQTYLN